MPLWMCNMNSSWLPCDHILNLGRFIRDLISSDLSMLLLKAIELYTKWHSKVDNTVRNSLVNSHLRLFSRCVQLYLGARTWWLLNGLFKSNPKFVPTITIMMHISASTALIRVKQKPLYPQLNAECDKHYYNSLFKRLGNPPELHF